MINNLQRSLIYLSWFIKILEKGFFSNNFAIKIFLKELLLIVFFIKGNTLNLIVFGKKAMRKISTFRFLFYLSASDLLVLLVGATGIFILSSFLILKFNLNLLYISNKDVLINNIFQFEIRTYSNALCKFHTFTTYWVINTFKWVYGIKYCKL